jgi:hypothetical protein
LPVFSPNPNPYKCQLPGYAPVNEWTCPRWEGLVFSMPEVERRAEYHRTYERWPGLRFVLPEATEPEAPWLGAGVVPHRAGRISGIGR